MDRRAWCATVHGVTKSQAQLWDYYLLKSLYICPTVHSVVSDSLRPPWTAAHQASLSTANSQSMLKLMSIESVMPSNHLILCHPLLFLASIFPASGSFLMSQFFASGGQSIGVSASASVLPMNTQDWFLLGWTGWISLQSRPHLLPRRWRMKCLLQTQPEGRQVGKQNKNKPQTCAVSPPAGRHKEGPSCPASCPACSNFCTHRGQAIRKPEEPQ